MIKNRAKINAEGKALKVMAVGDFNRFRGGYYDLGNGHTMLWSSVTNPQDRPVYGRREELAASMGKEKADWAVNRSRNLCIYPNMFLMDQMGTQIRMFRPLSVDKTEVTIYCFAPVGEPALERTKRIRQYEDFFNASGMATPDDLTEFNETQKGCNQLQRGALERHVARPGARGSRRRRPGRRARHRRPAAAAPRRPTKASSSPSTGAGPS